MKVLKETPNPVNESFKGVSRRLSKIQFRKSKENLGMIEAVLVVDSVLYAIIKKTKAEWDEVNHSNFPYFNNYLYAEDDYLSPSELLIPITNIDLSQGVVNPETLIGKYVSVSTIDGLRAIKAEYIGGVEDPEKGPLSVLQNVLYNARMLAGATAKLTEEGTKSKEYLESLLNLSSANMALLDMSLSDWKGKVVTLEGDASYHKTTDATQEFEIKVKVDDDFIKGLNKTKMKTKNCHLPVTIFTAR